MHSDEQKIQSRHGLLDFPENLLDEFVRPDLGLMSGKPVIRSPVFDDDRILSMSERELRTYLRLMNYSYKQLWPKLMQLTNHVPDEVCTRDPGAAVAIWVGAKAGKTDEQMAMELGDTVRFVQRMRLSLDASLKKPRGRPRNSSETL